MSHRIAENLDPEPLPPTVPPRCGKNLSPSDWNSVKGAGRSRRLAIAEPAGSALFACPIKGLRPIAARHRFSQATHAGRRHGVVTVWRAAGRNRIEEMIMGIIMIRCPATGREVSTGIEVFATDQLPVVTAKMSCPSCGRVHEWTKHDAWLASGGAEYRGEPHREGANG
jgi:hypothetical protein